MKILAIEGPDCCGKTTQIPRIQRWLEERRWGVVQAKQPGTTDVGLALRKILKDPDFGEEIGRSPLGERLLFLADAVFFIDNAITDIDSWKNDLVLLMDRHTFVSDLAYGSIEPQIMRILHEIADPHFKFRPDLVLILDMDFETIQKRLGARKEAPDRIEDIGVAHTQKLIDAYQNMQYTVPYPICHIDARNDPDTVFKDIKTALRARGF